MEKLEYLKTQLDLTISPMDYMKQQKTTSSSILVDVRNAPTHLKKEKIIGALEIPLSELESKLAQLPKDKEIIVYCWDVWCNMAKKASVILIENGYTVRELSGGIAAWKQLNLPTTSLV